MATLKIKCVGGGEIHLKSTFADKLMKKIDADFGIDIRKPTFAPIEVDIDVASAYKNNKQTSMKLTPKKKVAKKIPSSKSSKKPDPKKDAKKKAVKKVARRVVKKKVAGRSDTSQKRTTSSSKSVN